MLYRVGTSPVSIVASLEDPFTMLAIAFLAPLEIFGALAATEWKRDPLFVVFFVADDGVRIRFTRWGVEGAGGFGSKNTRSRRWWSGRIGGLLGEQCKSGGKLVSDILTNGTELGGDLMLNACDFRTVGLVGQQRRPGTCRGVFCNEFWSEKFNKICPGLVSFKIPGIELTFQLVATAFVCVTEAHDS